MGCRPARLSRAGTRVGLAPLTDVALRVLLPSVVAAAILLATSGASADDVRLGQFEGRGDVGAPQIAGASAYNPLSQDYALSAAGVNMWAQRDEFHFVWKRLK